MCFVFSGEFWDRVQMEPHELKQIGIDSVVLYMLQLKCVCTILFLEEGDKS